MIRQAFRSIVLSVLTVCFFAVVLFPRDRARAGRRASSDPIAGPIWGAAPSPPRPAAAPVASEQAGPASRERLDQPASVISPDVPAVVQSTAPGPAPSSSRNQPPERPLASALTVAVAAVEPPAEPSVSRRSSQPRASAPEIAGAPEAAEAPRRPVHRPLQAVTVAGPNETIRDVALRVYGSAAPIDQLWRANRDVLPERNSPLRPGTLLRTPAPRSRD